MTLLDPLLVVVLALLLFGAWWLSNRHSARSSRPIAPSASPSFATSQPAGSTQVNKARQATIANLQQIANAIEHYRVYHQGNYPATLEVDEGFLQFHGSKMRSPFAPPISQGDYAYHNYLWPPPAVPDQVIIAYDRAEPSAGTGAEVLHADGKITFISTSDLKAALASSDRAANAAVAKANSQQ